LCWGIGLPPALRLQLACRGIVGLVLVADCWCYVLHYVKHYSTILLNATLLQKYFRLYYPVYQSVTTVFCINATLYQK